MWDLNSCLKVSMIVGDVGSSEISYLDKKTSDGEGTPYFVWFWIEISSAVRGMTTITKFNNH